MREIEFTINASTGELTMHVKGIAGPSCEDVAKLGEELLGDPGHEWNTPEYYLRTHARSQVRPKQKQ